MTNIHDIVAAAPETAKNTNAETAQGIKNTLAALLGSEKPKQPTELGLMMVALYSVAMRRQLGLDAGFDSHINAMCNRVSETFARLNTEPRNEVQSELADAFAHAAYQYDRTEKNNEAVF